MLLYPAHFIVKKISLEIKDIFVDSKQICLVVLVFQNIGESLSLNLLRFSYIGSFGGKIFEAKISSLALGSFIIGHLVSRKTRGKMFDIPEV